MTNTGITIREVVRLLDGEPSPMKFDLFESSEWRRKLSEPAQDQSVAVQLSSGKVIKTQSGFLRFLRALAEELAKKEPQNH